MQCQRNLDTVEPGYNEVLRDWQKLFAKTRFNFDISRFSSINFTITGTKKIVRFTVDYE